MQMSAEDDSVEKLCALAEEQLRIYRKQLPQPGERLHYKDDESPLHSLEQAAVCYASAIRCRLRDARLHFLLGLVLEEQHYATEVYGLQRKADRGRDELSDARSIAFQDDILGVCKLHGLSGTPTVENQLRALDKEFQLLKEQGQSSKADYVQTLYIWLSKKTSKDSNAVMQDEESCVHRALVKYLDAWSLSPDNWEFSLHVGRLLLLQGRRREALQHLQSGLALRPLHPALRFFTGLALLQQEQRASEGTEKEAALFLHQGLEHVVSQLCSRSQVEWDPSDPLTRLNTHFLRGLLLLGQLQQRNTLPGRTVSAEQVYHLVAVLSAQSVSQCVCRSDATRQLERVLLDAHFALLQGISQQGKGQAEAGILTRSMVAKRCQALTALIRLTTITPCQELLDIQEKTCQLAAVTSPRDSHALCLLGLAQLAQYDSNPTSDKSKEARLSFQASIELEGKFQNGEPPEKLTRQKWWLNQVEAEKKVVPPSTASSTQAKAPFENSVVKRGAKQGRGGSTQGQVSPATSASIRGGSTQGQASPSTSASIRGGSTQGQVSPATSASIRGGPTQGQASPATSASIRGGPTQGQVSPATSASIRGGKAPRPPAKTPAVRGRAGAAAKTDQPGKPSSRSTTSKLPPNKSKQECFPKTEPAEEPVVPRVSVVNRMSHVPRLGLARVLSHSADTQEEAKQLYQEVITMAPGIHKAYIELARLLEPSDPGAAVDVCCRFPLKPAAEQSFDDAFITREIIRMLMSQEQYDHPQLGPSLVAHAKVMGASCIEEYMDMLDGKSRTTLVKSVYANIHDKEVDDPDLKDFFSFKCWI